MKKKNKNTLEAGVHKRHKKKKRAVFFFFFYFFRLAVRLRIIILLNFTARQNITYIYIIVVKN